ncbi:uncharacterized protein J2X06_001741 [Lysobacter niastensis]|uniref:DUF1311 domain-containing protein n=1 Tax=Lysobacter niastensis TaxID=380629 RepID=A0ABU1WAS2_9GAMM|nr:hypothetical protein [Lysobacter niastensis]MDR7134557.1 uncharacterized protein [Lysobacter niastensis]
MKSTPGYRFTGALMFLALFATSANGASFDCKKAASMPEMLICNDDELSRLDDELGRQYIAAKAVAPDQMAFKRQSEASWKWREEKCQTKECLVHWYENRRQVLQSTIVDGKRNSQATAQLKNPALAKAFHCPEDLPTDEARTDALTAFLQTARREHPNITTSELLSLRVRLIHDHQCDRTLASMASPPKSGRSEQTNALASPLVRDRKPHLDTLREARRIINEERASLLQESRRLDIEQKTVELAEGFDLKSIDLAEIERLRGWIAKDEAFLDRRVALFANFTKNLDRRLTAEVPTDFYGFWQNYESARNEQGRLIDELFDTKRAIYTEGKLILDLIEAQIGSASIVGDQVVFEDEIANKTRDSIVRRIVELTIKEDSLHEQVASLDRAAIAAPYSAQP